MKAQCKKCSYEWETSSLMITVSCPSCGNKVKIREIVKQKDKQINTEQEIKVNKNEQTYTKFNPI